MKTKITETIEITISYSPKDADERVRLLDLRDVLTEGARCYLPFGTAPSATWEIKRKNTETVSVTLAKETP